MRRKQKKHTWQTYQSLYGNKLKAKDNLERRSRVLDFTGHKYKVTLEFLSTADEQQVEKEITAILKRQLLIKLTAGDKEARKDEA